LKPPTGAASLFPTMRELLAVLEQLDDDEQRARAMCCACMHLGHYAEAEQFLCIARDAAAAKRASNPASS